MADAEDKSAAVDEQVSSFVERSLEKGAQFLTVLLTALATAAVAHGLKLNALENTANEVAAGQTTAPQPGTGGNGPQGAGGKGACSHSNRVTHLRRTSSLTPQKSEKCLL